MVKHILKKMWNERTSVVALLLELFLIALFLWYAMDLVYVQVRNYLQPTGWNLENTYQVKLSSPTEDDSDFIPNLTEKETSDALWTMYNRIKQYDGVEAVSISIGVVPGSSVMIKRNLYARHCSFPDNFYSPEMTPSAVDVFRFKDINGDSKAPKEALEAQKALATVDVLSLVNDGRATLTGDTLFGDEDLTAVYMLLGPMLQPIKNNRYTSSTPLIALPIEEEKLLYFGEVTEICFRVKPEAMPGFEERFMTEMKNQLSMGNIRFEGLQYLPDSFEEQAKSMRNDLLLNGALLVFLLVNILIGVVGVFSNKAQRSLGEIGLRISFGSTPSEAIRLFIYEGVITLIVGFILAAVVVALLFSVDFPDIKLIPLDLARYAEVLFVVFIIMLITLVLAVWLPTRKVTKIPPAQALREE